MKLKLDKSVYIGSGIDMIIFPHFLTLYELDWPLGIGVQVNAPSGMEFRPIYKTVVFGNLKILSLEVRL